MEWVKISDKQPPMRDDETGVPVLTYDKYGTMRVAVYSPSGVCWYDADNVTHWCELPAPPKEQKT